MPDREKVINGLFGAIGLIHGYIPKKVWINGDAERACRDAIALLKEQENLLGIQQTADSITFISTGTAQQGEERGMMLGKNMMHEWLKKELLHRGLLTNEIRSVFDEAKRI